MTETDVAWLAGLLEGEGCFRLIVPKSEARKNHRASAEVSLKMVDKDVVERVAMLMHAPSVYVGNDNHENHQTVYRCSVTGNRAFFVMSMVRPYMGQRRTAKIDSILARTDLSHQPKVPT